MKVLITGAKGQLGFEFCKLFTEKNIAYVATDYAELDITNKQIVDVFIASNDFTHVINCAAYNDVDGAEKDSDNCFLLNALAPEYLAMAAKRNGAIFVTYSTDFVFDGNTTTPYTEKDIPNPLSTYAKSKRQGEVRVLECYEKSLVIRTSWLFGIAGKNFNTQVLGWASNKTELKIVDDQLSAPTYARDLAYFTWLLLQKNVYGLYHISNSGIASKFDQAQYLLQKVGWEGTLVRAKSHEFILAAQRPAFSKLDSSKVENIVGEKIPSWQSGIDRWYDEWSHLQR